MYLTLVLFVTIKLLFINDYRAFFFFSMFDYPKQKQIHGEVLLNLTKTLDIINSSIHSMW